MTISEAAQLVIQATSLSKGGDVFILDMGEPVLIKELAEQMIRLSGLKVKTKDEKDGDIEIVNIDHHLDWLALQPNKMLNKNVNLCYLTLQFFFLEIFHFSVISQ